MVDGSACEIIGTGIVNITWRDGTMRAMETVHALEAVRYIPEAQCNLKSIGVLDEEGFRIQVQQDVTAVSQGDRVILEGEKCGEIIYKLKEGNSFRGGFRNKLERELIAR